MWFAALGTYERNYWFVALAGRLLEQTDGVCSNPDKRFCNQQVRNMMPWEAKTRQLAIDKVIAKGAWVSSCG